MIDNTIYIYHYIIYCYKMIVFIKYKMIVFIKYKIFLLEAKVYYFN